MKTVKLCIRVFLFYTLVFLIGRVLFYAFNFGATGFNIALLGSASLHGILMDFSMAGYLTMANVIILMVANLILFKRVAYLLNAVNILIIMILCNFIVINSRLYSYWSYHIDRSILDYLKTPKEALASANWLDWLLVVGVVIVFAYLAIRLYRLIVMRIMASYTVSRVDSIWSLAMSGLLIVPIRGGFDVATMNVSKVYFSNDLFENHLAINPVWNASFSLTETKVESFNFMDDIACERAYRTAYPVVNDTSQMQFPDNTNVIMIVLESFTANVVSSIGGIDGITPQLNHWMLTGLSFDNCYASADRSDKGLTTLFTGYPALPNARLLSHPNKLSKVPNVYSAFKNAGFHTSFYYGGNLDFANIKLLFSSGNVDKLVSGIDVASESKGKWGLRDEDMFDTFYSDVVAQKDPFFATLYTLSSHEPFDIPPVSFSSDSLTSDFYKSIFYTDSCFGDFMHKLKSSPVWENTIVVVTADHGVKNPGNLVLFSPRKFRVPLLITGGAVQKPKQYSHYCSHTDIPYSLEESILKGLPTGYQFSKSVFDTSNSKAFYHYVLGAGMVNEHGCVVFDIKGNTFFVNTTQNDSIFKVMQQQVLGVTQKASKNFLEF
ncbi:MAG: phosphoglycerol transferase MdoB-like AlkP superfamily enzyme [Bacteroidia bacterium]|jgi:phosphoglycerol transferase MdoB-like AlkP superfamily enzyme